MTNPYKTYLDEFFAALLDYRHATNRLNKVLENDVLAYASEGAQLHLGSALVISDWTGPTDNGWVVNFHTGIFKETVKKNYALEVNKIISRECCLMYAQSFEALEKYIKDCLFNKADRTEEFRKYIISLNKPGYQLTRETMPSGDNLFGSFKKAGGQAYTKASGENNPNIRFKELWKVLSEVRHAITHSRSIISASKINCSSHHSDIFNFLFNSSVIDNELLLVELDYHKFESLIKKLSEFAFQVLKILSTEEGIEWTVYK